MARFDTSGLDDLLADMTRLEQQTGPVAEAMTMAAAEVTKRCWQRAATEEGLIDTGAMIASIGYARKPTNFGDSLGIDIYPQGKDKSGTRNAEKAFILHYGSQRIDPTYWVDQAEGYASQEIPQALEAIWNAYIETGRIPAIDEIIGAVAASGTRKEII
jgi:hypothetical protein